MDAFSKKEGEMEFNFDYKDYVPSKNTFFKLKLDK